VVICEEFGKKYPKILFASMHPGWADTPAVRSSMPEFYEKMKVRLKAHMSLFDFSLK
jgi:dehydrogenase/reductase SDR family protein 12